MELIDRIKTIMKVNKLSATQLADEIGVQRSNVSHVLSGRNKPSFEFLNKLLTRFPKVNAHWLITGQSREEGITPLVSVSAQQDDKVEQTKANEISNAPSPHSNGAIERIVVFYSDGSFRNYDPGE